LYDLRSKTQDRCEENHSKESHYQEDDSEKDHRKTENKKEVASVQPA